MKALILTGTTLVWLLEIVLISFAIYFAAMDKPKQADIFGGVAVLVGLWVVTFNTCFFRVL